MQSPSNLALALLAIMVTPVLAADLPTTNPAANAGYLRDSNQQIVRSSAGDCWHTSSWTPSSATIIGCDGVIARAAPVAIPAAPPEPAPAQPAPAPKPVPVVPVVPPAPEPKSEKVTFETDTLFDFDKAVVKPEGKRKLNELASRLLTMTVEVVVAVGHTDAIGTDAYNQKLSERRAQAVKDYLLTQKIPADRIFIEGKGEKQPVADNKTREGRAKNRRVEVEVVGTRTKQQ